MSFNLIEAVKGLFTSDLLQKASAFLGENESSVSKALSGVLPGVLGGIVEKASTGDGATALAQMAEEQHSSGLLGNLGSFFGNEESGGLLNKGASMLAGMLGEQKSGLLTNLISGFSGIKSSSASSLLSMAAPAVMGLLGKHAKDNNLNAGGLASMLSSQKDNIAAAVPEGLNLGSLFSGWGGTAAKSINAIAGSATAAATAATQTEDSGGGPMKWLMPLLLLALLAAGALYFWNGCNKKDAGAADHGSGGAATSGEAGKSGDKAASEPATAAPTGKLDSTGNFVYDLGDIITLTLPNNGGELKVGKNSTEAKLIAFLNDKSAVVDTVKGNWFEFTNVRFKTGSAELTEESMVQLKNLVMISKAYPTAQFKIGGYTDNTGSAATNITLSQKRADAVAAMAKKLGAAPTAIVGAKGYGPEFPIASNDTKEGQAMNRRVAVNVKAK
jgi:OmpA-OmpF porin, OOP family